MTSKFWVFGIIIVLLSVSAIATYYPSGMGSLASFPANIVLQSPYNMTATFYYGDGSLLTGIVSGMWYNNSNVTTYNGSAYVQDNLSVGENIDVSESLVVGTGNRALRHSLWGSTFYFNLTYPANFNQNVSFDNSVSIGAPNSIYPLYVGTNTSGYSAYFEGNISVQGILDRTPGFKGTPDEALAGVVNIKSKDGKIDHSTLPEFAHAKYLRPERKTEIVNFVYDACEYDEITFEPYDCVEKSGSKVVKTEEWVEEDARDLGAMITLHTDAIKSLNNKILLLEAELSKKDAVIPSYE